MTEDHINGLQIEYRATADLVPYARNARTHSDSQVAQLATSIIEFGWTNPVLVDGANGIIAGHGRVLAAKKIGIEKVPVIELSHLTAAQRCAYVIADNKLAENAGWDRDVLRQEIQSLDTGEIDLAITGFDEREIKLLLGIDADLIQEQNMSEAFEILVICQGEREQRKLLERLTAEGYKCRSLMR